MNPALLLILASLVTIPSAQSATSSQIGGEHSPCEIWGQIAGSARLLQEGLDIEMAGVGHGPKEKVHVSATGNFDFQPVPAGAYHFRVTDRSGAVILDQTKSVGGENGFVFLVVRDPRSAIEARNTVSYAALQHKTAQRAWESFHAAQKAYGTGDREKCIRLLQDALAIDPDFPEAHSDLAAIYAGMGRIDEALEHARTAFSLNPQLPEAGCNFALLLMGLKRYPEAETAARRMLSEPYYNSVLHGVLAISLIQQRKAIEQALGHLDQAVTDLPFFRLLAARALGEIGRNDLAVVQVQQYLQSSAHNCERAALESWLATAQARLASNK